MLRGAYLAVFAGQGVAACLVALAVTLVAGRSAAPSNWVAGTVLLASSAQLLLGLAVSAYGARQVRRTAAFATLAHSDDSDVASPEELASGLHRARSAALSQALFSAVLLSTPAWFAAFAWATGQTTVSLAAFAGLLTLGYVFGALQFGQLSRAVSQPLAVGGRGRAAGR